MGGGPVNDCLVITLPFPEPASLIDSFRAQFPKVDVRYHDTAKQPPSREVWRDATVLCTLFAFPDDPKRDAQHLQWIQLFSAGSNQLQKHPLYTDTNVVITTSSGIHGPQIAEWAVMTALVASHNYKALYELQKHHHWPRGGESGKLRDVHDMVSRRIGILGYGSIGRQVGRIAKAMGMEVIAFTATAKDTPDARRDHGFVVPGTGDPAGEIPSAWYSGLEKKDLHNFLRQDLDWLLVAVPLTPQTQHLLSTEEFSVLSHGGSRPAFVTNIARGQIIDQAALITALKDKTLGGAALDVTDPEPLPEDSELWDLDNVIVTPHVSGTATSYTSRVFQLLTENLKRRESGEKLLNVVQRRRGY